MKVCLEALKLDGKVICYLEQPTEELCLSAMKHGTGYRHLIENHQIPQDWLDPVDGYLDVKEISNVLSSQQKRRLHQLDIEADLSIEKELTEEEIDSILIKHPKRLLALTGDQRTFQRCRMATALNSKMDFFSPYSHLNHKKRPTQ